MLCRQFIVTGKVQGVFFRASTRDVAMPLGVTGHAINLPNGSVEVLACGNSDALAKLGRWLDHGPPLAVVADVQSRVVHCTPPLEFSVG